MARPGLRMHPKFRRLVHLLDEPAPHVLGYLECMWAVGYDHGDPVLGDAIDVELAAEWPGETGRLCRSLLECRFVDEVKPGVYAIHDLLHHAPRYVQLRAKRHRERLSANGAQCAHDGAQHAQNVATPPTQHPTPNTPSPAGAGEGEDASASSSPDKPAKGTKGARKTAKPRKRDDLFDAIAEVTGSDPAASGSSIGKVQRSLEAAEPPYTPAEVRSLPGILSARGFSTPLTLGTVEKYIGWSRKPSESANGAGANMGRAGRVESPPGKYANVGTKVRTGPATPPEGAGGPLAGDQAAPGGGH